eukprot:3446002-Amphidinium_carterae.1
MFAYFKVKCTPKVGNVPVPPMEFASSPASDRSEGEELEKPESSASEENGEEEGIEEERTLDEAAVCRAQAAFDEFYRQQKLCCQQEWQRHFQCLLSPLPVCFRLNGLSKLEGLETQALLLGPFQRWCPQPISWCP